MSQLQNLQEYVYYNFLGGPKQFKMRHVINFFKGATLPYVILLMIIFRNYSLGMHIYLALHGSYGIIWLLKDWLFPDKTFENKATFGSLIIVTTLLIMYWSLPFFIAIGWGIQTPSYIRITLSIMIYSIGAVLMIGSDAQKTFTLRYKKGNYFDNTGLISDGLFTYTRNPNYLGEVMIYGSFAIVTGYIYSYVILGIVWSTLFTANMLLK